MRAFRKNALYTNSDGIIKRRMSKAEFAEHTFVLSSRYNAYLHNAFYRERATGEN